MQARVKKVALPAPKLQPTREYHEEFKIPEGWEAQRAAKKENRRGEEKKAYTERLSRVDECRAEGADRGKRSREELDGDRRGIRSDGDRRTDTDVARKEGRAMTVRCIYGGTVQEASEKAGMKGWCDKHCKTLGMERGHICYAALKKAGINPEEEHKK